jgi:exopolyphosphatase/guanosine-5'-triphosphate,3'-diphosphate pyrophosphatase
VTTLATLLLGLNSWDRDRVHHATFAMADVHDLVERLLSMTFAERQVMGVPAGRADVIGAGAVILDRVLRRSGASRLTVSDSDILDGIAWSVA